MDSLKNEYSPLLTMCVCETCKTRLLDKKVSAMKAKFGKRKTEDQLQVDVVKKKDVWGVPNFLPSREAGEDDHSIEHHINRLKDQAAINVAKRNKEIINIYPYKKHTHNGGKC